MQFIWKKLKLSMDISECYRILGVPEGASEEEIKRAFWELAKKYHPDRVPPEKKKWAEEKFKKISAAYHILTKARYKRSDNVWDEIEKEWAKVYSHFEELRKEFERFSEEIERNFQRLDEILERVFYTSLITFRFTMILFGLVLSNVVTFIPAFVIVPVMYLISLSADFILKKKICVKPLMEIPYFITTVIYIVRELGRGKERKRSKEERKEGKLDRR